MLPKSTFNNLPPEKQETILRVVLEEFSQNGYRKTSINTIVARLGIAKGSIFQYFEDKEGLFLFILNRSLEKVKQYLRAVREATTDQDLFSRLEQTLQAGVDFLKSEPQVYRLYLRVMFESQVPYRQEILASIRGYSHDFLKDLILTACERGELRETIDPDVAAFILDAVLDRYLQALSIRHLDAGLGLLERDATANQRWIRRIVELLQKGLAAPALVR
ncbi:MAG: TetR/AcrR family transcriptional regulator [Desulfobacterales bacterium]|nr:TetR/AcrR family transcriptional regulator [Desulfobacterales bacterium]MDJ0874794.1 TetR/AcrR family transcriptional regulator [Desulfobacterales bacterium]MDJ0883592.1 TetR/AcrR family transcriptional regulator [Desulfobacterales bacterium]